MNTKETIIELLKGTKRSGIEDLIKWLETTDFFTAPASTKFHGNFEGGLAEHSLKVYKIYNKLNKDFNRKIPDESIVINSLLHDICKTNIYQIEEKNRKVNGKWETYQGYIVKDTNPLGHGSKSVILINKFIKLSDLEQYSIFWHMGQPNDYIESLMYSQALEIEPNVILLHVADYLSTVLYEKINK